MKKHFVTFYSPGTFVDEETTKEVKSWDVKLAKKMAYDITERYNALPFGFMFFTKEGGGKNWNPKTVKTSPLYYLGGKVETLEQVRARATKDDEILISNMECNKIKKVITNNNSYKTTRPFREGKDIILDWVPKKEASK
jgi:hypothetical protein